MAVFKYAGKNRAGASQKGVIEAADQATAVAQLRRQGVLGASVKPKSRDIQFKIPGFEPGVSEKDLVTFTRQFATMIDAGLPLVQCLEILGNQQDNKTFKRVLIQVRQDVESGSNLADYMRKHPKAFPDLYVNMVAAGEAGGILDTILNRLAQYMEKAMALKGKVKSAMIYPSTII